MKRWMVSLCLLLLAATLNTASAQVLLRGDIDVWSHGSRLRIYSERIVNESTEPTDILRFRVWATDRPWGLLGDKHSLGTVQIGRLGAEQGRWDVYRSTRISWPDRGWWFVTLTLEERAFDQNGKRIWLIRDVVEFDEDWFPGHWDPFWPWD
jgi:hypothetical protein